MSKERVKPGETANVVRRPRRSEVQGPSSACARARHAYNVALIASMLAHHGEGRDPQPGLKASKANHAAQAAGQRPGASQGGVSKVSATSPSPTRTTWAKMQTNDEKPEQKKWADSHPRDLPEPRYRKRSRHTHERVRRRRSEGCQESRGNAVKILVEWLSGEEAQQTYAEVNFEYPVPSAGVAACGYWSKRGVSSKAIRSEHGSRSPSNREAATKLVDRSELRRRADQLTADKSSKRPNSSGRTPFL